MLIAHGQSEYMKIYSVKIHNFRSIKEILFYLEDYSLLVGENNAGKTNIITALRIFYEDNGIKFVENRDFPKFETDNESWIEIEFVTSSAEQENLKGDYKSENKILKVRRYLKSEEHYKQNQSNIYGYENGNLSSNLFYGAKNISQAKLGKTIYIPELSTTDEALKLSGPSPFRDMVNFVFKKIVTSSKAFQSLNSAIDSFNQNFMEESSNDGFSMDTLKKEINDNIKHWDVDFGMKVNPIQPQEIVKFLFSYFIKDKELNSSEIDVNSLGQGLQRYLIYTLIMLSAKYVEKIEEKNNVFSPDFTLLLFEEPEAFLHPSQQVQLNYGLGKLSQEMNQQILITTHSPIFVSKNIDGLRALLKVKKQGPNTFTFQLRNEDVDELLDENLSFFREFSNVLKHPETCKELKAKIIHQKLGQMETNNEEKLEEEGIKYFMWLDSERSASFFARHIVICEGASEKIFLDYLVSNIWSEFIDKHIYILDSMGKYNIHRYMNLFGKLGISHSVLYDKDSDKEIQEIVNKFIESNKNECTKKIHTFDKDFEDYLGISKDGVRPNLKPLNVLTNYKNSKISEDKLNKLHKLIEELSRF
jgi:predicted ATP-dependent endonuclease of OLD family